MGAQTILWNAILIISITNSKFVNVNIKRRFVILGENMAVLLIHMNWYVYF